MRIISAAKPFYWATTGLRCAAPGLIWVTEFSGLGRLAVPLGEVPGGVLRFDLDHIAPTRRRQAVKIALDVDF
jgi:hypothetical protein